MKKFHLFATIFLSLFLCISCGYNEDLKLELVNWEYATDSLKTVYKPIETSQFPKISKLLPERKGDIYLRTYFTIPDELKDEKLKVFLGNIKIANEFYLNGNYIDHNGLIGEKPFSSGSAASAYILPPTLCKKNGLNEIIIHIQVDCEGRIGESPYISTERRVTAHEKRFNFLNSKMHMIISMVMFLIGIMYFTVYSLRRQDKQYLSFALLNIFSSFFLIYFFVDEYPIFTDLNVSYLLVQKLFRGISAALSSYFAVSFMRDYIGYNESLTRKIYRTALTIGPCFFLGFTQTMHDFFLYLGITYIGTLFQMLFAVHFIIISFKTTKKKVIELLIGFTPVLVTVFVVSLLLLFNKKVYSLMIVFGWQVVIFTFLAMLIISFATMSNRVEFLNANLERLVQNRTEELTKSNTALEESNTHLKYEIERAEKEIELASFVQQSFYNIKLPEFKNYEVAYYNKPMAGVSGDLYDFYFTKDTLNGFGLFDVSGHGISSGLVTMLVKNIINDEFNKGKKLPLEEVMNITNDRIITQKGNVENYLTGVLARINGNNVDFVNAGHPNVILYRAKTNTLEIIKRGENKESGIIGISGFPVTFECVSVPIEKGDIMLLYTDGVTETMNRNREEFGVERLKRIFLKNTDLKIQEQIANIVDEAKTFANRTKIADDITLVMVKKK
ncbi:MAG: SpoIIE family protein phosphatase [Treponema sp.]|nr:SpoIIE family protein phosphatase [Treponema sp.]